MRRPHLACRRACHQAPLVAWLLCFGLLVPQRAGAAQVLVSTPQEFAAAFVDNSTDVIVLTTDLQVNPDNWASYSVDQPCLVQRPLLITSQPAFRLLNYQFLQAKCLIEPNITVTYADIVLANTRYGSGSNIDFFVASPNATIIARDAVRRRLACVPSRADPAQLQLLPRSPAYPGTQKASRDSNFCIRNFCMPNVTHFDDFAVLGNQEADTAAYAGAYTLWYQNATLICMTLVTTACVDQKGPDQCVIELINAALGQQSGDGGSSGVPVVAIALPVAIGALLLALLVGALVWRRRRQRALRRAADEEAAAGAKLAMASNNGPGSGNINSLLPGQTPKSADGWHMMAFRTAADFVKESNDKIQLGVLIGAGAHGRVYKGQWQGQEVAVKVLQHNSSTAHRVARECNLIMAFSHPYIVRAYHFVTWRQGDGHPTPPQSQLNSGQMQTHGSRQSQNSGRAVLDSAAAMHGSRGAVTSSSSAAALTTAVQSVAALLRAGQQRQQQDEDEAEQQHGQQQQQSEQERQNSASTEDSAVAPSSDAAVAVLSVGTFSDAPPATGLSGGSESEGHVDAQTWLVTEYCDSSTLHDVSRSGRLTQVDGVPTLDPLLWRLREVADAMCYLHTRNVLHGDLKSANVLCARAPNRPFGMVSKVSDFGLSLALAEGQTHKSTRALGTVTHMAPEMLRTGRLAPACDVYSFGVLMWELLTSRYAFQGKHYGEIIERVVLHDERPAIPEDAPEDYVLLMSSCWAAKPKLRPTFEAVRQCLDIMLQQRREEQEAEAAAAGLVAGLVPQPHNASYSGSYAGSSGNVMSGAATRSHPSFARSTRFDSDGGNGGQRVIDGDATEPNEGFF